VLPKSLDPDALRNVALGGLAVLVLVAFLVMRFIQKMVLRVILWGVLAGFGLYLWGQRQELQDCVPRNDCRFMGFDVHIPGTIPGRPAPTGP
jgi:hypothetical protein